MWLNTDCRLRSRKVKVCVVGNRLTIYCTVTFCYSKHFNHRTWLQRLLRLRQRRGRGRQSYDQLHHQLQYSGLSLLEREGWQVGHWRMSGRRGVTVVLISTPPPLLHPTPPPPHPSSIPPLLPYTFFVWRQFVCVSPWATDLPVCDVGPTMPLFISDCLQIINYF